MTGSSEPEEQKSTEYSAPGKRVVDYDSDSEIFSDGSSEDENEDEDEDEESSDSSGKESVEFKSESGDSEIDSSESEDDDERYELANRIRKELGLKKARSFKEFEENCIIITRSDTYKRQIPSTGWRFGGFGKEADKDLVREYNRQIRESDGFDVTVYPGPCPNATILPVYFEEQPQLHEDLVVMATKALRNYNFHNADSNVENRKDVPYKFEKIERATSYAVQGMMYLITFQARGANDIIRTFRARVWSFMEKNKVLFIQRQPQPQEKLQSLAHSDLVVIATEALDKYNNNDIRNRKGVPYKFKKIEKSTCRGKIYLITFQARGANGITRAFQAKVWNFMGKKKIQFIRIKPYWRSRKEGKGKLF